MYHHFIIVHCQKNSIEWIYHILGICLFIWVVSTLGLLWIRHLWTFMHKFSFLLFIHLGVEMPDHKTPLYFTFWGTIKLLFPVTNTYENILFLVFWIISLEYFSGNRVPVPKIWTFLWLLLFSTCTAFQKDWTSLHSYHISYMYHVCMHVYTHTHFSTQQTYEEHATVNLIFIDEDTKGHRG